MKLSPNTHGGEVLVSCAAQSINLIKQTVHILKSITGYQLINYQLTINAEENHTFTALTEINLLHSELSCIQTDKQKNILVQEHKSKT